MNMLSASAKSSSVIEDFFARGWSTGTPTTSWHVAIESTDSFGDGSEMMTMPKSISSSSSFCLLGPFFKKVDGKVWMLASEIAVDTWEQEGPDHWRDADADSSLLQLFVIIDFDKSILHVAQSHIHAA